MTIHFSNPVEETTQEQNSANAVATTATTTSAGHHSQEGGDAAAAPQSDDKAGGATENAHTAGMRAGEGGPRAEATDPSADYDARRKEIECMTYDLMYYACHLSDVFGYHYGGDNITIPVNKLIEIVAGAQMAARRAADELAAYSMELEDLEYQADKIARSKIAAQEGTLKQYAQELEATKKALAKERQSSSNAVDLYGYLYCMVADRLNDEDRKKLGDFNRTLYQKRHKQS